MNAIILCGSRNPEGQTARAAGALLDGLKAGGADGQVVLLPPLHLERCRQCEDSGWGLCRREGTCIIQDDFAGLVRQLKAADLAVFATPVYFSDLSESLRALLDRLRRTCCNENGRIGLADKPAVGVCVAGGGGGGAPACCTRLEQILQTARFNVVDMVPARRQNLEAKIDLLRTLGRWLATAQIGT
jgi:multimeric flavodoxin WrbA